MSPFPRDENRPWPSRNNQLLFSAAIALSAIRALDHAFVDRETGTSASDHLASGLIPTATAMLLIIGRRPHARRSSSYQ
jgi:hypothetical protein